MELGMEWIAQYGYLAIFVLLMLGIIGLPVPDETILLFAGYLSFKGDLRLEPTLHPIWPRPIGGWNDGESMCFSLPILSLESDILRRSLRVPPCFLPRCLLGSLIPAR